MIYKMRRNIKKYWILFITFFVINIFLMGIVVEILKLADEYSTRNSLISENGKMISFSGIKDVNLKRLLSMMDNEKLVMETIVTKYNNQDESDVVGVYYNYEIEKKYPLVEGRMFNINEMKEENKVAIVGYNFIDDITENNTIKINNEDYCVIGILGDKNGNLLNNKIYINLNPLNFDINDKVFSIDVLDSKVINIADNIYNTLKKEQKNISVSVMDNKGAKNPLLEAIDINKFYIIICALIVICLISTVINISIYWIKNEKYSIGVKSLVGGSKIKLLLKFWKEYQITVVLAVASSYVIWILLNKSSIDTLNYKVILKSAGALAILDIIVSTLAIIPPSIKLNEIQINSIIKENT